MCVHQGCRMDTCFYDKRVANIEPGVCDVRIGPGAEIVVSYCDDDGQVLYRGADQGGGHYVLACVPQNGRATLHRQDGSRILEGYWSEDGDEGMWRIWLDGTPTGPRDEEVRS